MPDQNFDISTRAMLASLKITSWSSSKMDKEITADVIERAEAADGKAARVTKALVGKDAMKAIKKIASEARTTHYEITLPWSNEGQRLLPVSMMDRHTAELRRLEGEFNDEVNSFISEYERHVDEARARLGHMWRAEDYPLDDEVREKFTWEVVYAPVPSAQDFRLNLSADAVEAIRMQYEEHSQVVIAQANRNLWERAKVVVEHMVNSLEAYRPATEGQRVQGAFHASLVENVKAVAELLPQLNVANDPELARVAEQMNERLAETSAEVLRESPVVRGRVLSDAEVLLATINNSIQS